MSNVFTSRTLSVIDDMSIDERKYLFEKTKILKDAWIDQDEQILNQFRIDNSDFGIYEVFLEDSTRTRESFRNAAAFHRVKVSDLAVGTSSFNKGRVTQIHSIPLPVTKIACSLLEANSKGCVHGFTKQPLLLQKEITF